MTGMKKSVLPFILFTLLFVSCNSGKSSNQKDDTMESTSIDSINFKSDYSVVNGLKMYYELHGNNGNYLVLIHGGGSTITTSFGTIIPLLAKKFRVVAVELQSHGHTGNRDEPESFEQDADDVASLLGNLHIDKASFFGFSNGGNTAMQIAVRHPEIVDRLVIASAFYKRNGLIPGFFDGMQHAGPDDMPEVLKNAFLMINPDTNALMAMFTNDRDRMLRFRDWSDDVLRSIKAPSLLIFGDHDVVLPEHAVAMSKLIANSRLMILPGLHGEYIGVEEIGKVDDTLVALTIDEIRSFLKNLSE